ncbi:deoxyribodipyrimidine photo-lyase-like isoform X3 [Lepidochelys kempii]|uniref:deoxyribodipyrimidine photo-lyase-like isoform X3 n=1 Tax=Lepidochelys kempii TaxID=8472 RepID=UPI003C6ECDF7
MSQKSRNRRAHGREDTTASPAGCGDTARTRTAAVPRGQLKGKRKVLAEPSGAEALTVAKRRRKEGEAVEGGGAGSLGEAVRQARLRVAPSVQEFKYNKKRVRLVSESSDLKDAAKGVVYWMSRDQRVQDNWAFLYAQRLALKQQLPLHVCFCLVPKFLEATIRHFGFMLKGLQEVAEECQELDIPFHLLIGFAKDVLPAFVTDRGLGGVVTDFSPLRVPMQWVEDVKERLLGDVPFVQVDAHNIVPCWVTSDKQEYGARTIRRKIHDRLPEFLTEFPPVIKHPFPPTAPAEPIDWSACRASLQVDCSVKEVRWAMPGTAAGLAMLESFIGERLKSFGTDRNNPTRAALSNLSPWFHFGAYDWAKTTLKLHAQDKRSHLYELKQLEEGKTHDPLWNAAQLQMVHEGKMHGFLRMYWAKKILEWTRSPEEALKFAIYLNDRYELDGRDPNGYVGCMWSICGIHDQGWAERAVFGKIRYMNYAGCKRKFDVGQFERRYDPRKLGQ